MRIEILLGLIAPLLLGAHIGRHAAGERVAVADPMLTCSAGPEYYRIDLVSTRKLPGTYAASGFVDVQYARSPFGVALSPTGQYVYDFDVKLADVKAQPKGHYVVWLATPTLQDVQHVGPLSAQFEVSGQVTFNKFLVVVSLEQDGYDIARWTGPIAFRGLSRSGKMHTSIGHGLFQDEPCVQYGFN